MKNSFRRCLSDNPSSLGSAYVNNIVNIKIRAKHKDCSRRKIHNKVFEEKCHKGDGEEHTISTDKVLG